jgi:hypothetical protein
MPHSSAVNIALAKKAKIVTGSEMPPFFAAKLKAAGGDPANSILARFGGSVTVGGVRIATVRRCTATVSTPATSAANSARPWPKPASPATSAWPRATC